MSISQAQSVLTAGDVPMSGEVLVAEGAIITPSARDLARERGVTIRHVPAARLAEAAADPARIVAIGSDHGGYRMKQWLLPILAELGFNGHDVGVHAERAVDYPDIAVSVAALVASGKAFRGVIVDGAGIGSSMAANKVRGIRAALCWDMASARNSREHNNANILTLGGRLLTESQAESVLRVWLTTPFAGGRHQARVDKIMKIEDEQRR